MIQKKMFYGSDHHELNEECEREKNLTSTLTYETFYPTTTITFKDMLKWTIKDPKPKYVLDKNLTKDFLCGIENIYIYNIHDKHCLR